MREYDPLHSPDPTEWLALDEAERIQLVRDYHEREGVKLPSLQAHSAVHAIVETQVAMGSALSVASTLTRLQSEGLERHDAVHAIGSVLVKQFHGIALGGVAADPTPAYTAALERLNAKSWSHAR